MLNPCDSITPIFLHFLLLDRPFLGQAEPEDDEEDDEGSPEDASPRADTEEGHGDQERRMHGNCTR